MVYSRIFGLIDSGGAVRGGFVEQEFRRIIELAELPAGSRLLLAVSGGVDSVVLLDLLVRNAADLGLQLSVLHLDHQIRPASRADADFVRELCLRLEIPCRIESVDVPALARTRRLSLEAAGREARREALTAWAEAQGSTRILLAHHCDDQAETFLQRLLRGSGQSGLQGMAVLDGLWWRPLLRFSRRQILTYAEKRKLAWVEDASNADTGFLRNRIRHRLLPELSAYNPQIVQRLNSLGRQFQLEEDFWRQQLAAVWPGMLLSDDDGLRIDRQRLLACHPALQLRLLREGLRLLRGDLRGIETVHLEALLGLVQGGRSQAELDLPACWAARRYGQLWLRRSPPQIEPFDLSLEIGRPLPLPDGRVLLAELRPQALVESRDLVAFDATRLKFPLQVRSLRAGDRFCPSGMAGRRKVKDFLIDLKLEKERRRALPVLLNQQEILWLVGLRRSALAPVTDDGREILVVRLLERVDSATKPL